MDTSAISVPPENCDELRVGIMSGPRAKGKGQAEPEKVEGRMGKEGRNGKGRCGKSKETL
jgi:hypothetical protein